MAPRPSAMPRSIPRPAALVLALALSACADRDDPAAPDCCAIPEPLPTFAGSFLPLDDGASVPGFARFRDSLRSVVARQDTAALLARVAPGAQASFSGTATGPDAFRAVWFSGPTPNGLSLWRTLGAVLEAGSVEEDGAITAPYVYGMWPGEKDPGAHVAIVRGDVTAYAQPGGIGPVAEVAHIILPTGGAAAGGWQPIRLPNGDAAYVPSDVALGPAGYRASFWEDAEGRWRLQSFLADG